MPRDAGHEAFLLVSQSGRALAAAAARAGRTAVGIDGFADRDTRGLARDWLRLPLDADGAFETDALADAATHLSPAGQCLGLVYGSGFEAQPERLARIADNRPLLGNAPAVLAACADPIRFADLCRTLHLPHPETRLDAPDAPSGRSNPGGWLAKRAGASGGFHVRDAAGLTAAPGRYFQRHAAGVPHSLLFLADGRSSRPVGFNRLFAAPTQAPGPWAYAGATALRDAPPGAGPAVLAAAQALTAALGLRGLNGIDFVVDGNDWTLLELNARPTATLDLWDAPPLPPLFDCHVQACRGRLPIALPRPATSRAVAVVYAGASLCVPAGFAWPRGCADLPAAGTGFGPGEPVCTVHATGEDADDAERQAQRQRQQILERLAETGRADTARSNFAAERAACTPFSSCSA
jgi:predicted ATP-grasp superfamily ATP-dependent carboligase